MRLDPRDFVIVARGVSTFRTQEMAASRTGVGRAYYGAFNAAADVLFKIGHDVGDGPQAHHNTLELLRLSGDGAFEDASTSLKRLGRLRRKADYQLKFNAEVDAPGSADTAINLAEKVLGAVDLVSQDTGRCFRIRTALIETAATLGLNKLRRSRD